MFKLLRRYFDHGTYSTLHREDGSQVCCVVEVKWLNNAPSKSCVPEGDYKLVPHQSPKYGDCYALSAPTLGVTPHQGGLRTSCLFHIANVPSELKGCCAPGESFGYVSGEWGVVSSGNAFRALMKELAGRTIDLRIEKA